MFNFFWKALGYHVCDEFTQWKLEIEEWVKTVSLKNIPIMQMPYVQKVQIRECTICGKMQRRTLD